MTIKQEETISLIEHFAIVAEKDLEIVLLKQRLVNAQRTINSYANDFQKHGLAYKPQP